MARGLLTSGAEIVFTQRTHTMESGAVQHVRRILEQAQPRSLDKIVAQMNGAHDLEGFPRDLLPKLLALYQHEDGWLQICDVIKLLKITGSSELYAAAVLKIPYHEEFFIDLMEAGFRHRHLEGEVGRILLRTCLNDGNPYRRGAVRAMRETGGQMSLRVLQQVSLRLADFIGDRAARFRYQPPVGEWDAMFEEDFINYGRMFRVTVDDAIVHIRNRMRSVARGTNGM